MFQSLLTGPADDRFRVLCRGDNTSNSPKELLADSIMETTANVLAELRRESQSIFNRIHSIAEDAAFVQQVHDHYPDLPLLRTFISPLRGYPAETRAAANMRCGAWYTDPSIVSNRSPYCTLTLTLTGARLPQSVPTSNLQTAIRTTGALIYADLISTFFP